MPPQPDSACVACRQQGARLVAAPLCSELLETQCSSLSQAVVWLPQGCEGTTIREQEQVPRAREPGWSGCGLQCVVPLKCSFYQAEGRLDARPLGSICDLAALP